MSDVDTGPITALEREIGLIMPMALDLVATVVETPAMGPEDYEAVTAVVESQSPVLFLALLRIAAGFAAIADMDPDQVRALTEPDGP